MWRFIMSSIRKIKKITIDNLSIKNYNNPLYFYKQNYIINNI
jgi:hypothetical protein